MRVRHWIVPDWPAPPWVHACTTTRIGGVSAGPYKSFNLAEHVGDDSAAVIENRRLLAEALALPDSPFWLRQVHGDTVHLLHDPFSEAGAVEADASITRQAGRVCAVLTADCVPVLLCNRTGTQVGAVHAGWRGLAAGVIEAAAAAWGEPCGEILAWLGPAIGRDHYEVGEDVVRAFHIEGGAAVAAFVPSAAGRWLADLHMLVRRSLERAGVRGIYGGDRCTYSDPHRFYSFRRDRVTGRMASVIWIGDRR